MEHPSIRNIDGSTTFNCVLANRRALEQSEEFM